MESLILLLQITYINGQIHTLNYDKEGIETVFRLTSRKKYGAAICVISP
jgi:hypothetical protein